MLHLNDVLPVNVSKPDMLLHLVRSIQTESIGWLSLQTLVDKVSGLHTPAVRDVGFLQLDLLLKYLVSDLFPSLSLIRTLSKHELVAYNAQGKVVNSYSMILSAHYFRSHVSRSTRCIMSIIW